MPHMIDESNGRAACFTAGEAPWHKLGVTVPEAVHADEAIKLANLDWEVEQWPV